MTAGKLLKIDLTWKKFTNEPLIRPDLFPGGRATCSILAYHYFKAKDLAVGEKSYFFITTGLLTGTGFPGSNRVALAGKSVVNGTLVTEILPGSFGPSLRATGIDHLVIAGQAKELSYVVIGDEGHVNIRPKPDLAGSSGREVESRLKKLLGKEIAVIASGVAGEKQSPFATLYHEGRSTSAGGFGTILCSKNLKAIVIEELGERITPTVEEPEFLSSLEKEVKHSSITTVVGKEMSTAGKMWYLDKLHQRKGLPAKNYHLNAYPDSRAFSLENIVPLLEKGNDESCNCSINCPTKIILQEEEHSLPELASIVALGSQCGIYKLDRILNAVERCIDLGLDPVMVGISLACLIEVIKKKKLLTEEKIDWNHPRIRVYIDDFLENKHSFSRALARGGSLLINKYNEEFPGCKKTSGMPVDLNMSWGSLLQSATNNQGMPAHLKGSLVPFEFLGLPFHVNPTSFAGKPQLLAFTGNIECLLDSLIWCHDLYLAGLVKLVDGETLQGKLLKTAVLHGPGKSGLNRVFNVKKIAEILKALLGGNTTVKDVLQTGERTWMMELMFNLRDGRPASDDWLPKRFFVKNMEYIGVPGINDFQKAIKSYYTTRGLNSEKMPLNKTLKRLKIDEIL
ncbi:MAG: aldehyde ferredoxin oxidoreductase C-terminal domain-containing protein [Candidatus Hodarchaeales archaeon]